MSAGELAAEAPLVRTPVGNEVELLGRQTRDGLVVVRHRSVRRWCAQPEQLAPANEAGRALLERLVAAHRAQVPPGVAPPRRIG